MDIPFLHITLPELIQAVGYVGIFIIVFIESGVPIGLILPLPGDTLLFSAGLLAATSIFDLPPLIVTVIVAAILGDSAGYWFGSHFGPKLFTKEEALFFSKQNLERTKQFYKRFGALAIVIARFLPFFRTAMPIAAGIGHMRYDVFLTFNIVGACIWGVSVTLLGYYLGSMIPNIDHYLLPIVLGISAVIGLSIWYEAWKAKRDKKRGETE